MLVRELRQDIINEGNRQPITVEITWLEEEAVLDYIDKIQRETPRYQIARNNCSHIIALALMAGANRRPSFTPHAGRYHALGRVIGYGIWTPDQILRFARELQGR